MTWCIGRDDILYRYRKVYISTVLVLREEILKTYYDNPLIGHFDSERILYLLRRYWFWPRMEDEVKEYIASYDIY